MSEGENAAVPRKICSKIDHKYRGGAAHRKMKRSNLSLRCTYFSLTAMAKTQARRKFVLKQAQIPSLVILARTVRIKCA